ncbi:MAG: type II secretion system F family protein [Chlamydiota bacterium]|nr:type II secretion system F family protein [Chlamydiota bacterium]
MPLYQYQAIDPAGKKKSGVIEGSNENEIKAILRGQGVMVTHLTEKAGVSSKQNIRGEHLLAFTIQLSQLVNAGVPLYDSLLAMEEQYRGEKFHRVILSISEQIKAGKPLSDAMAKFPESFEHLYCAMIKAGESVGALDLVLTRLAEFLQKRDKLKKQLSTAMIYPAILGSFSLLIIALLLGFVVPSIEGIFEGRELNGFTETVLSVSHFLRDYWWVYIPMIIGAMVYAYFFLGSPKGKLWLQRNSIKVPLIKNLIIQTGISRFCRTMGTLQSGGLTMIESLRIAREVIGNVVLEESVKNAEEKIIEGSALSIEFAKSEWIPKMVSRMLSVGEETGNTQLIFNKIADMYEEEIGKSLDRVMALSQPLILIVMGSIIGLVMLAILLPLTDVSSFSF